VDLPRRDLVNLYKAADLFVLASHVEYSPLVLFEAAAAGTPFLASGAGNSEEIARWTGGGTVIEPMGVDSAKLSVGRLAAELELVLRDTKRLTSIGESSRAKIWANGFTWEKIVKKYGELMLSQDKAKL
jgi:glycosyltransferase involved in cell wall biosynthesis